MINRGSNFSISCTSCDLQIRFMTLTGEIYLFMAFERLPMKVIWVELIEERGWRGIDSAGLWCAMWWTSEMRRETNSCEVLSCLLSMDSCLLSSMYVSTGVELSGCFLFSLYESWAEGLCRGLWDWQWVFRGFRNVNYIQFWWLLWGIDL